MNFNNYSILEIIEEFASDNNLIDSEEALSERFDQMIDEMLEADCKSIDTEDEPMMSEAFNNWSDGLCKDGELHDEQYSKYEYVGKYS